MQKIKVLSPEIAATIAAGEVIERPASIVKELIENSIDASATKIQIEVLGGGIESIIVQDNGFGMHPDDLPLAVKNHATSKINTIDDLASIASLGFRGEALSSISAVAKITLISRVTDALSAFSYSPNMPIEAVAAACGSKIIVKDLFYNIPARRKFLKSAKTELQAIEEVVKRQALGNFAIAFTLISEKGTKHYPACKENAYKMRVANIIGTDFLEAIEEIKVTSVSLSLYGFINKQYFLTDSGGQYFYINNRVVKDRLIIHAIKAALQEYIPAGKYPCYALYLTIAPELIDVNVHPSKTEVRFSNPYMVHNFITQAIKGKATFLDNTNYSANSPSYTASTMTHAAKVLSKLQDILLLEQEQELILIAFKEILKEHTKAILTGYLNNGSMSKILLEPVIISKYLAEKSIKLWEDLGFSINIIGKNEFSVTKVPKILGSTLLDFPKFIEENCNLNELNKIINAISEYRSNLPVANEEIINLYQLYPKWYKKLDATALINLFR